MILLGCEGGFGRGMIGLVGVVGGGGYGGRGGKGYYKGYFVDGGVIYGNYKFFCEFGSGSGNVSFGDFMIGGGIIGLLYVVYYYFY